jgi:hypothetical protein
LQAGGHQYRGNLHDFHIDYLRDDFHLHLHRPGYEYQRHDLALHGFRERRDNPAVLGFHHGGHEFRHYLEGEQHYRRQ